MLNIVVSVKIRRKLFGTFSTQNVSDKSRNDGSRFFGILVRNDIRAPVDLGMSAWICKGFCLRIIPMLGNEPIFKAENVKIDHIACTCKIINDLQNDEIGIFKRSYNVDSRFYGCLLQACNRCDKRLPAVCKRQIVLRVLFGKQTIRQFQIS